MQNNLIPALKQVAFAEGENTNCDETWCRVKTARRYKKHYIWCLANNAETNTKVSNLVCRLNDMLNIYDNLSNQMQKAVNYLKNFWKQQGRRDLCYLPFDYKDLQVVKRLS